MWTVLRSVDFTMEALKSHRRFYTSSVLWQISENTFSQSPNHKKKTLAKLETTTALQGSSWVRASKLPGAFQMKGPSVSASYYPAGLSSSVTLLALHCCTMKILLYCIFFRQSTAPHSVCRVGLLRANFQSHAFYGKCILNHAASH